MASAQVPPTFREYADDLRNLRGWARASRRRELASLFDVSQTTISRWLHHLNIVSHARSDKGKRLVEERELYEVFAIQYSSHKQTQGPIMTAQDAIEIAEHNGKLRPGVLTPSSYNAWLRAHQIARDEVDIPEPHINLRSLGPNHVHQVDFSLAINWKIQNNRAVYQDLVYKNKLPAAGTPRLLRLIVTDHTSGNFAVWYTAAPGESVSALIEGLWYAWTPKTYEGRSIQDVYPFRGVPRILMMDRGPGSRSQVLQNFLDWLDVRLNVCQGARSKGQVEIAHWWWEQRFESRFRLEPPVSIERLNDEANAFAAKLCKEVIHYRTQAPRTAHWEFHLNRNWESQLRVPNCTFEEAMRYAVSAEKTAVVGGSGIVQFRGNKYRVPEVLLHEKRVNVQFSPFEFPNVILRAVDQPNAQPFLCQPIMFNEHGFAVDSAIIGAEFKSHKQSARAQAVSQAKQAVQEFSATGQRLVTRGYHLEGLEASGIRSHEAPIEAGAEAPVYSNAQARREVIERVGRPLEVAEKRLLSGFGPAVTEEEIDAVVQAISAGVRAAVVPMRTANAV